jgi:Ca-activated chloride channel family protein
LLEKAATAANGTFIPAEVSDKATRIRGALKSLRTARRAIDTREDHLPRFLWLLVPALLLLVYDAWRLSAPASIAQRRSDARAIGAAPSAWIVWLLVLVPGTFIGCATEPDPAALFKEGRVAEAVAAYRAMVAQGDASARTAYNLGTAVLGADSVQEAQALLESVIKNSEGDVRARARFNAGVAALQQGRAANNPEAEQQLAAARAAYRAYLTERPGYADAKWNFELALRKQPPQGGGGGGGGGGGNDRNNDPQPQPQSQGGLDQRQADALLNSAAREEKDVQGRRQRQGRVPPGGKDW